MNRNNLLQSPNYWIAGYQIDLYRLIEEYRLNHNLSKKQLAITLGISKREMNKLCKGEAKLNKRTLIEIPLKLGYQPIITFEKDRIK